MAVEEEEEYVSEAGLPAALEEFTATYRDAETITGNIKYTCYNIGRQNALGSIWQC